MLVISFNIINKIILFILQKKIVYFSELQY